MAVRLRASEKRILADTVAALQEELQTLPSALTDSDDFVDTDLALGESRGGGVGVGARNQQQPAGKGKAGTGAIQAAGRSFDVLSRRTTVQSAKSPADWVDFRNTAAETEASGNSRDVASERSTTGDKITVAVGEKKSEQRRARRRK